MRKLLLGLTLALATSSYAVQTLTDPVVSSLAPYNIESLDPAELEELNQVRISCDSNLNKVCSSISPELTEFTSVRCEKVSYGLIDKYLYAGELILAQILKSYKSNQASGTGEHQAMMKQEYHGPEAETDLNYYGLLYNINESDSKFEFFALEGNSFSGKDSGNPEFISEIDCK